jgi:AraC-like DNA-binding protein
MANQQAATARAILAGLRAMGLDAEALRAAAGISAADLTAVDGILPPDSLTRLWQEILRRVPRPEIVTELGLAIPYGAFGALDYLAGSSNDVGAAFHSLAIYFRSVAAGMALEVIEDPGGGEVRVLHLVAQEERTRWISDEFTLAVLVARFASRLPTFAAAEVRLTCPAPAAPTRHAALLRAPVVFGCATGALRIAAPSWNAAMPDADPMLQETLRALAQRLELGGGDDGLEPAIRARLRSLLPEGTSEAAAVARALGMSERTLHRRLQEQRLTYREVLDGFREAEAERLLAGARTALSEVALRLGFADQSAWNRAFRRWKGMSPKQWAAGRR